MQFSQSHSHSRRNFLEHVPLSVHFTNVNAYRFDIDILDGSRSIQECDHSICSKSHLLLLEKCEANYTLFWMGLLLLYTFSIIVAVVVLAFKSLGIRYKQFKDTKATNAFAFLSIFNDVVGLFYWFFLRSLEQNVSNDRKIFVPDPFYRASLPSVLVHFTRPSNDIWPRIQWKARPQDWADSAFEMQLNHTNNNSYL